MDVAFDGVDGIMCKLFAFKLLLALLLFDDDDVAFGDSRSSPAPPNEEEPFAVAGVPPTLDVDVDGVGDDNEPMVEDDDEAFDVEVVDVVLLEDGVGLSVAPWLELAVAVAGAAIEMGGTDEAASTSSGDANLLRPSSMTSSGKYLDSSPRFLLFLRFQKSMMGESRGSPDLR